MKIKENYLSKDVALKRLIDTVTEEILADSLYDHIYEDCFEYLFNEERIFSEEHAKDLLNDYGMVKAINEYVAFEKKYHHFGELTNLSDLANRLVFINGYLLFHESELIDRAYTVALSNKDEGLEKMVSIFKACLVDNKGKYNY